MGAMTTDNRTNGPTPEQIEAAAKAMYGRDLARSKEAYPDRPNFWAKDRPTYAEHAALAIAAADAVVTVDAREHLHAKCDCVPDLGPAHCHLCSNERGAPVPWPECSAVAPVVTVDGLQERIEDTLAYYQCRETNPKADHPSMGYHAFSEEQREFLRARKSEAAAEIVRMILALLRGGGRG